MEKRLCFKLHTYFVLTAVGEHFDSLKRTRLFHTCELGDWTRVEFLRNIQACLQTHRSRGKCTVNVRQFCKHWDTNSQQCWGSIIIICFETKLQNKDERFYLLLKGRRQKCVAVVRIRKCEELPFPFPWNSIFRSGSTHYLWDGWHTPSLRWLAYSISEWDGKSHSQGIHFARSHSFGGKYFWRTDFSIAVWFVCRFYTQTIFLQFTRIICLEVIVHFKHTHVHKRQNAASRCDSSVAFSLQQFELFQTTCDRPEAVQFIPDCSVVLKIGL